MMPKKLYALMLFDAFIKMIQLQIVNLHFEKELSWADILDNLDKNFPERKAKQLA